MPQQKICTKLSMNLFKIVYRQKKKKKKIIKKNKKKKKKKKKEGNTVSWLH